MTTAAAPPALPLPATDAPASEWERWLGDRCDGALGRVRQLAGQITSGEASAPLEVWNEANIAMADAFAAATLFSQVHPDEDVRTRAERAEQDAHKLQTELAQDRGLYDVLAAIDPDTLEDSGGTRADEGVAGGGARRVLAHTLREFRRAGVDRDDATRERIRELSERGTELGQRFSRNIRDGERTLHLDPALLDGLPADFVAAHPAGDEGRVAITTAYPDYIPFMTFATDRSARRALLGEFLNRAWPENDAVLRELLQVRREHAELLGYADWPSYDAEIKMIGSGPAIIDFVDKIAASAEAAGRRDYAVLLDRLRADHPEADAVDATDKAYYGEVIRRERFDVDAQQVRVYFDFAKVRAGLLAVTGRLFGLEYVAAPDAPSWHPDVAVYDVRSDGQTIGRIHLDLHPRAGKYSHAAQFDLVPGIAGRQLPEGVLVCNFSRGLMEHDDVVTLFHEFGHLVHHVLAGRQRWARFSGVATEWDFVEAPSQLLEEWAWDADVLRTFATDAAGEPIGRELVAKMRAGKEFGKGLQARTQMFYAALAYRFHAQLPADLTAAVRDLQARYDLYAYVPDTHFHASFGHLEGYTSGYYTYMWSLVIAKDLFSAFDPDDLFDATIARRYRDRILSPGGSADAADLVEAFLGRPSGFDAFARWLDTEPVPAP